MKWKNIGGGTFQVEAGRIIKSGEIFEADPQQVPQIFRDTIIPLDPDQDPPQTLTRKKAPAKQDPDPPTGKYSIQKRNAGWFDVVDQDGNYANESALRSGEAEELMLKLNREG
jgi:hypothetical protein